MDTEDLIKYINQKLIEVDTIIECLDVNNLAHTNPIFSSSLKEAKFYLNRVKEDVEEKNVPYSFFQKISHNIQSINLQSIYINCLKENEGNYNDFKISQLTHLISRHSINVNNLYTSYIFFSDLNFVQSNTVIIGANGSGKSTLATTLKSTIDERDGIVIPAQKLLIVPTFDNTPNFSNSEQEYKKYQESYSDGKTTYNASQTNDIPYSETQKYGAEYKFVLKTLLAERGYIRNIFCNKVEKGEMPTKEELNSKLDKAISIWNKLIEHRELICNESNNLIIKDIKKKEEYPAHKMSDGEKNILYLIGRILLSPENALIIIDEPEMYLHKSIVNKLWDNLESERNDCIFVYLTHDLDFASSRSAYKYWIKDFIFPNKWHIEKLPENEIPENLLMKLLGSRKKILFCEGKKESLDIKIYEILFRDFTIAPVSSCTDVINYVRAFNKISTKNIDAIGIIDRDFRVEEQLLKLETENIYSYSVAEIENLFLIKDFVLKFSIFKNENINIDKLEEKVLKMLKRDIEIQSSNYLSSLLNHRFTESHIKKGNTLKDVENNLSDFLNTTDLIKTHQERKELIENIVFNKKYDLAIKMYNNKGLLGCVEELLGMKSGTYRFKALDFLKIDEHAKEILKKSFELDFKF